MPWDPKTYLAFADERTRPARDLLSRVELAVPHRIADLGCGPGNSTALLAQKWPNAGIAGIDSSADMLAAARATPSQAQWVEADVATWAPDGACDLIFANATLQWLPDHAALLPRLFSFLGPDGVLAFQMPRNFREPSHALMAELAAEPRWHGKLDGVRDWWNVLEPDAYYDLFAATARRIDIWETRYVQLLEGPDAVYRWTLGTGLRPFAAALDGEERESFLAEYRARVARAYPMRGNNITLFPFQRLFCVIAK